MQKWQVMAWEQAAALVTCGRPTPRAHEVLVRIHACALNFADLLMAQGKYQEMPELPFTPGLEWAGEVQSVGVDVKDFFIGQRVMGYTGHGGLAQYGAFDAARLLAIPDMMPYETAAALQIAYGTSYMALADKANLRAGETVVVSGAAGGVGLTAVEIAKKLGARVIALARGDDKLAVAQAAGADIVIDSDAEDLTARLRALGGVDVAYETIGGAVFKAISRAMRPDGRILAIGFASGDVPQVSLNHLLVKNVTIIGFWWGGYINFAPERLFDATRRLCDLYVDGRITPYVSKVFSFEDYPKALDSLRMRETTGKIVIRVT